MVMVVFRFHAHPQADLEELGALTQEMVGHVSEMPGFGGIKDFASEDGEVVVIAEFDSLDSVDAWKAHPDHMAAQRRGRQEFFADYQIQVCELIRSNEFVADH